jgi:hypothetical protein
MSDICTSPSEVSSVIASLKQREMKNTYKI